MAPVAPSSLYENETLSPLPKVLHHGLAAVSFFGFLSFFATTALLAFLTYRLIQWRRSGGPKDGYNQFILLIYNLVFADLQQSIAFLINSRWAHKDALEADTSACFAQGWFISVGQLGTGVWILAIAVHTFAAVIFDYKLSRLRFAFTIIVLWTFIYLMAIIGVAAHPGDIYERAGAWCWINQKYAPLRLWLHYFWIFISMFAIMIIYGAAYVLLRRRLKSNHFAASSHMTQQANVAARYMVIYPLAYVICTLPIAATRMTAMTGKTVPYAVYIFAGAMITSNGWLDVLLYSLTRRVIVFSDIPPVDDCGLMTFGGGFGNDGFGNSVVIEGGISNLNGATEGAKDVTVKEHDVCGNGKTGFKTTTVTVEIHRNPMINLEKLRLPDLRKNDLDWDSTSSSST